MKQLENIPFVNRTVLAKRTLVVRLIGRFQAQLRMDRIAYLPWLARVCVCAPHNLHLAVSVRITLQLTSID